MSLTLEVEQRLDSVTLTKFYSKSPARWDTLAKRTYKFAKENFPQSAAVRRDDVAKALLPLLEVNEKLGDYLNKQKLKQKYWIRNFCDLIIDRCWEQISKN